MVPAVVAMALVGALVLPNVASAAAHRTSVQAAISKTDKSQNTLIKKTRRTLAQIKSDLAALKSKNAKDDKSLSDRLGVLESAGGLIVNVLGQLASGETQLASALTTVGNGLQTVGTAVTSTEYGVAGVFEGTTQVGGSAATIISPDIPDSGNPAVANGSIPYAAPSAGPHTLTLRGTIRSAESDRNGEAGQMGGLLYAKCATPGGCGGPATSGSIVCSVGPPPATPYKLPDGSTHNLSLLSIGATGLTDTSHPSPSDRNAAEGATATPAAPGSDCTITAPAPGVVYELVAQVQFTDLPTSLSPGPSD